MNIFAQILKQPAKFDCLKHPSVLALEMLKATSFHYVALVIFILAIIHTLQVHKIQKLAHKLEIKAQKRTPLTHLLLFLSQVEVVFAFWVIPLFIAIRYFYDWEVALEYINTRDYTEPLFVVVILSLTATRPIIYIAETLIRWCAKGLGGSLGSWWFVLLTLGPLLGSLITETGAMALCALLLSRQFYVYQPSTKLSYGTLALLFVNISVGGILTNFASPAVLVLSHCWNWTSSDMFIHFGWKAVLGIILANLLYWLYFRKEISLMDAKRREKPLKELSFEQSIPYWITCVHILFIVWIVSISHYPAVFIASFLFFLGFHQITKEHQYPVRLAHPMLIGLFLAGLVIHGGVQGWWVVQLLHGLSPLSVMGVAISLAAFTDNTLIAYLAAQIPNWGQVFQYVIFTGVIAGGGLTVIANAPNPAGYAILKHHFKEGIIPLRLFLAALLPTVLLYIIFYVFGPNFT